MSAQDPDIQSLFQLARQRTPWQWNDGAPPHVFATNEISEGHRTILRTSYGDADFDTNQQRIVERSCFLAYGKPLLAALVLNVLSDKVCRLVERTEMPTRQAADFQELTSGVRHLRDAIAADIGDDKIGFVRSLVRHLTRAKAMLLEGRPSLADPAQYRPITDRPGRHILGDPNIVATGQGEAASALALLGLGMRDGHWNIILSDASDPGSGVFRVGSELRQARVIFVAHDNADVRLFNEGAYAQDDDDVVILHSMDPGERQVRSPARRLPGGRRGPRHVAVGKMTRECQSLDALRTLFRQEVGL
jgi:hypothetical protein